MWIAEEGVWVVKQVVGEFWVLGFGLISKLIGI